MFIKNRNKTIHDQLYSQRISLKVKHNNLY